MTDIIKPANITQLESWLTSMGNAIRTKGGTSAKFKSPQEMLNAVNTIATGTDISPFTDIKTEVRTIATASKTLTISPIKNLQFVFGFTSEKTAKDSAAGSTLGIMYFSALVDTKLYSPNNKIFDVSGVSVDYQWNFKSVSLQLDRRFPKEPFTFRSDKAVFPKGQMMIVQCAGTALH